MNLENQITESILKTKRSLKKIGFQNKYQISKYVLDYVLSQWGENDAIMNLRDRVKELENENGLLTSELNELIDTKLKSTPFKLGKLVFEKSGSIINSLSQNLSVKDEVIEDLLIDNTKIKTYRSQIHILKQKNHKLGKELFKKTNDYEVIKEVLMDTIKKNRMTFDLNKRIGEKRKEISQRK
jgi:hypothetical protein